MIRNTGCKVYGVSEKIWEYGKEKMELREK